MIDKGEWGWLRGTTKHLERFEIDIKNQGQMASKYACTVSRKNISFWIQIIENSNFNETLYRN